MEDDVIGQVITFYSYKGGTGRTMSLANVACLLAERQSQLRGKGVLMIDWDLEAPGLHQYFRDHFKNHFRTKSKSRQPRTQYNRAYKGHLGLIDLFVEINDALGDNYTEETVHQLFDAKVENYILKSDLPSLSFLKAGRFDADYSSKVNQFQWEALYNKAPWLFQAFADWLTERYDYVLIDSRTGVTDIGSICTALMPEKLVAAFTPNRQSVTGVLEQVRKAAAYRLKSNDLRPLVVYPLPSRIEATEPGLRKSWRSGDKEQNITGYQPQFEKLFKKIYDLDECNLTNYFDEIQIQHVPSFAYGEKIAVLIEDEKDRLSLTRSYESFVKWLLSSSNVWETLLPNPFSELTLKIRNWLSQIEQPFSLMEENVKYLSGISDSEKETEDYKSVIQSYDRLAAARNQAQLLLHKFYALSKIGDADNTQLLSQELRELQELLRTTNPIAELQTTKT